MLLRSHRLIFKRTQFSMPCIKQHITKDKKQTCTLNKIFALDSIDLKHFDVMIEKI